MCSKLIAQMSFEQFARLPLMIRQRRARGDPFEQRASELIEFA